MPAAVIMNDGGHDGSRIDLDGGPKMNGHNGSAADDSRNAPAKEAPSNAVAAQPIAKQSQGPPRMNDLPDEIKHITDGFIPLSRLLSRLAQSTHNKLQERIIYLAGLPLPSNATNGNATSSSAAVDDTSNENLQKKATLLAFAQEVHATFVKALVITEWSRKADMVSKLIDINMHIYEQKGLFNTVLDALMNTNRAVADAQMPSPDLKTALHVLSTGTAPWFPDLNYIEPPPISVEEKLTWINDLNTHLSLRLNLDEFDKIPPQFRDYEIRSGRVTFKVPGEFEVDLTIADEDFEKQFWFIDFRFDFKPAAASLSDSLRMSLEWCVNSALEKDGLAGCYHFLHELVLTSKINEIKRQALQLSKGSWAGTLVVEQLHRALAIQYWTSRTASAGLKSWVLIAVNSGRKKNAPEDEKPASYLTAKWYRENKEVEGVEIRLDVVNLSAENLLRHVIGMHIEFVLRGIHDKLLEAPRFQNKQAGMLLNISKSDPAASHLTTQVGFSSDVTLSMEPITGVFAIKPHSKITFQFEHHLNNCRDMITGGLTNVEYVRCSLFEEKLSRQGSRNGWHTARPPMSMEEIKTMTKKRDWTRSIWIQRDGWDSRWFVAVFLSLGGDEWWLLETNSGDLNYSPALQARLPFHRGCPDLSDEFWQTFTTFTTGMIAQSIDSRELYLRQIKNKASADPSQPAGKLFRLPVLEIELSTLFPSMVLSSTAGGFGAGQGSTSDAPPLRHPAATKSLGSRQPWAKNMVTIMFKGLHARSRRQSDSGAEENAVDAGRLVCISVATIRVRDKSKLAHLGGAIDRDVSYKPQTGEFSIRIRHHVGESTLSILKSRLMAIDRFVSFLEALDQTNGAIVRDTATLREVSCFYGQEPSQQTENKEQDVTAAQKRWRLVLDLSKDEIQVKLEENNPSLRLVDILQRLANLDGGIKALLAWLPMSLPAISAIDKIEAAWQEDSIVSQGFVSFSFRALDWIGIHYKLHGENIRLSLECSTKSRKDGLWWHLRRPTPNGAALEDRFGQALKPIWEGRGKNWQGLMTGAAGRADGGVANLLEKADDAIRALVTPNADGDKLSIAV
ncbi:unnamed protein product [Clonostachys byssicola]|uniref:Mediator of RNA polymerase II transcription subunit 14 n=1 Tax=Clonostachys byssicola TaxID=160290 RepID=A0A9N9UWV1_9HYPO|nr:unnamed protein product [Clonostachys byssicola]